MAGRPWAEEERAVLMDNYLTMTCREMSRLLPGRTTRAIQHEFANMELERPQPKVGDKLGRLTILDIYQEDIGIQMRSVAKVECECGARKEVRLTAMVAGKTVSCGCLRDEKARERTIIRSTTHGMSHTPMYGTWSGMHARCKYPSMKHYKDYGGRGISVCEEWSSFETFRDWAVVNGHQDGLEIDRKDVNGNYEPANCRWVTKKEQANNKRTSHYEVAFGERKTLLDWSRDERCVVSYQALFDRLGKLKWDSVEEALTSPTGNQGTRRTV